MTVALTNVMPSQGGGPALLTLAPPAPKRRSTKGPRPAAVPTFLNVMQNVTFGSPMSACFSGGCANPTPAFCAETGKAANRNTRIAPRATLDGRRMSTSWV
jgi:hypothetical protein